MRLSHIGWNLAGLTVPLAIAGFSVPHLIEILGNERFGLLALAWGLIGYAGAMDLGIGRALTQLVAKMKGAKKSDDIPHALATAGRITLVSGLIGALAIAVFAIAGGGSIVAAQETSDTEIKLSILLLAVALPAQAISATYRGLNEAFLNFRGISVLRAALGTVNFAGPYAVSLFTIQLPWLIATLVLSRLLALAIYRYLAMCCMKQDGIFCPTRQYSPVIARSLFSFGGWVTVSSIVSPILVQADRFVIAASISAAAVSIYVIPYEVVVQSLVLVGAVSSVAFPALSRMIQEKPNDWRFYFQNWLLRVTGMMAIICTAIAFLLPIILPIWLKNNLNPQSIQIGQVLCLGVFANAIGSMYYVQLHARECSAATALLHLIELPFFIFALLLAIPKMGVMGAAWAWTGRMIIDSLGLFLISRLKHD